MTNDIEVVFPRSMRDIFPAAAQAVYIEAYKQSWAKSAEGTHKQMSLEGVAARDAWDAVKREFAEDPFTHKWRRIGEQVAEEPTGKKSFLGGIKGVFKRKA
jgi:cation transport regulator ChaB